MLAERVKLTVNGSRTSPQWLLGLIKSKTTNEIIEWLQESFITPFVRTLGHR